MSNQAEPSMVKLRTEPSVRPLMTLAACLNASMLLEL